MEKIIDLDPKAGCLYWQYKGVKYYHNKKYHDAEMCFNEASNVYSDERYIALNNYQRFFIFKKRNQLNEAKELIEKAKDIFNKYGAFKRVYSCNMCVADIYSHYHQYDLAINQYRSCIYLAKLMHYTDNNLAILYRNIAWNYIKANQFEEALKELENAKKIDKTNPLLILYYIYSYFRMEQIDKAKEWIIIGRRRFTLSEYQNILDLFSGLVRSYGKTPETNLIQKAIKVYQYYQKLGDYELIIFYLDIVIELYEQKEDWENTYFYLKDKNNYILQYQI